MGPCNGMNFYFIAQNDESLDEFLGSCSKDVVAEILRSYVKFEQNSMSLCNRSICDKNYENRQKCREIFDMLADYPKNLKVEEK